MTPKFGINSPQTVKHISQKAFFKHALGLKKCGSYLVLQQEMAKAQ